MNDQTPEEMRYKVRRRTGHGEHRHVEILGPRGWTPEGGDDGRPGIGPVARYVADLLRARRNLRR